MSDTNTPATTEEKSRILLVEDDVALQALTKYNLEKMGYTVSVASSGTEALDQAMSRRPDLIILDWMLPGGMSGVDVCRKLRSAENLTDVPVIMLTARAEEEDTIRGLENGADDYLVKPVSFPTLDARIRALLRRLTASYDQLRFEDILLDTTRHKVERAGRRLQLGPTEYRLLEFFMRAPGRVFSREHILRSIWGENIHVEIRTVDVHIRRLRRELNAPGEYDPIRTVRSAGYALEVEGSST